MEIVVAIVVIAILATISAIGFGAWRERVAETEVKSDISGVMAGMEDHRNFNNGYPTFGEGSEFDGSNNTADIFRSSEGVRLTYVSGDGKSYCVEAQSTARPSVFYFFSSADNDTTAKKGTCDGGEGATPPSPNQTIFVFDTTAPGCAGTVQLPVSQPSSGGTINWSDGVTQASSGSLMSHTYSTSGKYTASYEGPISQASYQDSVNTANAKCLTRVNQWANNISPTKIGFYNATNLTFVAEPPRTVTDMSWLFYRATSFNQPIGSWDTSNVTNMGWMFQFESSFNQPIGNWDTSNATQMTCMFQLAGSFNQNVSGWNVNAVTNWTNFRGSSPLTFVNTPPKSL